MARRSLSLAAVVLAVLATAVPVGRSQPPVRDRVVGAWVLVPDVSTGRRTIRRAYDRVLRDANAIIRGIARQRLDVDQQLPRRIEVAIEGRTITTTLHTSRRIRWRTREGYATEVRGDDGSEAELTQHFRDGHLELMSTFPEGRRWIQLTPQGDDRLTMSTTIDPMMIDDNVHFTLPYRRAD